MIPDVSSESFKQPTSDTMGSEKLENLKFGTGYGKTVVTMLGIVMSYLIQLTHLLRLKLHFCILLPGNCYTATCMYIT